MGRLLEIQLFLIRLYLLSLLSNYTISAVHRRCISSYMADGQARRVEWEWGEDDSACNIGILIWSWEFYNAYMKAYIEKR